MKNSEKFTHKYIQRYMANLRRALYNKVYKICISAGEGSAVIFPVLQVSYNLLLLIAYAAVVSSACCYGILRRQPQTLALAGLFAFYLLDTAIIFMTEVIPSFSDWYDQVFLTTPAIKTILYLGMAFFELRVWNAWLGRRFSVPQVVALICLGLWYLLLPLIPAWAWKAYLYFLAYQVFSVCICVFGLRVLGRMPGDGHKTLRRLLWITIAGSLLITLEDSFVIFFVDVYTASVVRMQNQNVSESILRLLYTVIVLRLLFRQGRQAVPQGTAQEAVGAPEIQPPEAEGVTEIQPPEAEGDGEPGPADTAKDPPDHLKAFAQATGLTERELEVFALLLENRSNQQISESLYISTGTVKAHIHNIFQKVGVTRRYELLRKYDMFP